MPCLCGAVDCLACFPEQQEVCRQCGGTGTITLMSYGTRERDVLCDYCQDVPEGRDAGDDDGAEYGDPSDALFERLTAGD